MESPSITVEVARASSIYSFHLATGIYKRISLIECIAAAFDSYLSIDVNSSNYANVIFIYFGYKVRLSNINLKAVPTFRTNEDMAKMYSSWSSQI